ncbi:MAG: class I lanthipeptide [Bacteroidales bacterium]|nr:class I lanthipeptide [Bacteroidales bacterium]
MAKNLKKLSFAKEELVNLNEYEMSHIKGGEEGWTTIPKFTKWAKKSSRPCLIKVGKAVSLEIASEIASNAITGMTEGVQEEASGQDWSCDYVTEDNACQLEAVVITAQRKD